MSACGFVKHLNRVAFGNEGITRKGAGVIAMLGIEIRKIIAPKKRVMKPSASGVGNLTTYWAKRLGFMKVKSTPRKTVIKEGWQNGDVRSVKSKVIEDRS